MAGISNVTIEESIEEANDDFQRNFAGVFSSDRMTPFLNFLKMLKRKGGYYHFTILNTDRSNLLDTHWRSILNIYPKSNCFYLIAMGFRL